MIATTTRVLLVALLITGGPAVPVACATSVASRSAERGEATWVREELYFGARMPGGGEVSDDAWMRFVEEEIAPRFPDGFTVLEGEGRWRSIDGPLQVEPSRIVVIVRPADDDPGDQAIVFLIEAYKRRFRQESVLRVTDRVEARF